MKKLFKQGHYYFSIDDADPPRIFRCDRNYLIPIRSVGLPIPCPKDGSHWVEFYTNKKTEPIKIVGEPIL